MALISWFCILFLSIRNNCVKVNNLVFEGHLDHWVTGIEHEVAEQHCWAEERFFTTESDNPV